MLSDQVQDLRRTFILLEYFAKVMRGFEVEQRVQAAELRSFGKRFDSLEIRMSNVEDRLDGVILELKSHKKEFETINSTLDIISQAVVDHTAELANHAREFILNRKEHASIQEQLDAHTKEHALTNAKLDKIMAHLGIS